MRQEAHIRAARPDELAGIERLIAARLPDLVQRDDPVVPGTQLLAGLIEDGCLIAAEVQQQLAGVIAVDLGQQQLVACHLDPALLDRRAAVNLIKAAEQHALAFGLRRLYCSVKRAALSFMYKLGYDLEDDARTDEGPIKLVKPLEAAAADWMRKVFTLHEKLGIPEHYGARRRLRLIPDCSSLESIGFDIYEREQFMHPEAAAAWRKMRDSAAQAGVLLQPVSAFRGREYQAGLIQTKLDRGLSIKQILSVSAAPGYSEHHSGRALDLKAPGSATLEEDFAKTSAYRWLKANAGFFGFHETLGPTNRHGIIWEPWHWCYHHD